MKRMKSILPVLLFALLLLLRPERAASSVREGLELCAHTVIPSLFPFLAAVSLLLQLGLADCLRGLCAPFMGPMFQLRGICAMPLIAGLLGGYPSGAKTAADLYREGLLTRQEAELLLGFADNCGPAFLLSFVGAGVLQSARTGVWLFLIHVLSALLTGMLLCRLQRDRGPGLLGNNLPEKPTPFPQALTAAAASAVSAMLNICAFVVLFRVVVGLLPARLPAGVLGALEMVTGVAALEPGPAGFIAAAGIVGWGGLSVHCQAMAVAAPAGLSFRWHWLGKGIQAGLSVLLALALAGWVY